MYFKVKITKRLPQAKTGGFTGNNLNKQVISFGGADMNAASRHLENTRYLKEVPREEANLEAEKGESAFGDINGDGYTEHMLIGGKRHSEGGTPLNLPDGTFIFSDTAAMKIKDPAILAKFGKKSGSFTPAELAKPYDINKYRKILEDPNSDKVDKKSAELMIKNINLKLGALALAQESKKGFPQGIPEVALPYMQQMGIKEEDLIPQKPQAEAQVDQQAMQNPYENQGMGEQSSEEEMMEQGPGMQNPQEEMMEMPPMAQYGIAMGDYSRPAQQLYKNGGSLDKYQSKGEVKSKAYTKEQLPKDAIVRDRLTVDVQAGDFIKQTDGTYLKVSKSGTGKVTADTKSLGISVDEFKKESPENAKLIEDANAIILKGINDKTITEEPKNSGKIKITGDWKGDFKDRILLSRALNATNAKGVFGTDKYKIVSQGATGPYSKLNPKTKKIKGTGSFVAGFTPELYEQRYIYEQAKGLGMTDDEAFAEVDRIKKDDKSRALLRRQFASTLGIKDIPTDDKALLSEDFYKKNYADVTKGIESLGASEYRPAIGDEQLSGFEHFDALGYKPEYQYEQDIPVTEEDAATAENELAIAETPEAQYQQNPEWWLQDKVNMGLAASDYFDVQKALPWAARYEPELMDPTYYDPTRELAAQSEQANIANQALAQFTGPQALSARSASIQGQGAKQAADTLGRYNAQNVGVANQFASNNAQIMNEAQRFNQAQNKQLYDQNVIANQQYKNTKRALRHNLGEAFNTGTTNMMKTDAMNQMYPQYTVDPRSGGRMHFTKGKDVKPTYNEDLLSYANKVNASGLPERVQAKMIDNYMQQNGSSGGTGEPNMYMHKKGGPVQMAYVMGSNVFPFMFT
jgi:hypothetical protein